MGARVDYMYSFKGLNEETKEPPSNIQLLARRRCARRAPESVSLSATWFRFWGDGVDLSSRARRRRLLLPFMNSLSFVRSDLIF